MTEDGEMGQAHNRRRPGRVESFGVERVRSSVEKFAPSPFPPSLDREHKVFELNSSHQELLPRMT